MPSLRISLINEHDTNPPFESGHRDIQAMMEEALLATLTKQGVAYNVFLGDKIIAQYMLSVEYVTTDDYSWSYGNNKHSGILLKYIVVEEGSRNQGIGKHLLKVIVNRAKKLSDEWPIRFLMVNSVQDKIEWYKEKGFHVVPGTTVDDGYTTRMVIDFLDRRGLERIAQANR